MSYPFTSEEFKILVKMCLFLSDLDCHAKKKTCAMSVLSNSEWRRRSNNDTVNERATTSPPVTAVLTGTGGLHTQQTLLTACGGGKWRWAEGLFVFSVYIQMIHRSYIGIWVRKGLKVMNWKVWGSWAMLEIKETHFITDYLNPTMTLKFTLILKFF